MEFKFTKELDSIRKALTALSKVGIVIVFIVNVVFVGGLVWFYSKWVDKSSPVVELVQIMLLILAFFCLGLIFYLYITYKRVDRAFIPGEITEDGISNAEDGKGNSD